MSTTGKTILALAVGVLIVGVVFVGMSAVKGSEPEGGTGQTQNPVAADAGAPQVQQATGVAVQAIFNPLVAAGQKAVAFEITMNTHSIELGELDLTKMGKVILGPGAELTDLVWTPKGDGRGHHVEGLLMAQDPNGFLALADTVILEFSGMPGDRTLQYQWKAQSQ